MQRPRWSGTFRRAPAGPGIGAQGEARKDGESHEPARYDKGHEPEQGGKPR
ncbi:hypothetical protein SCWH03_52110 [Streptomyces pacificus]|uniref:Uncharacterized protein n=1 Tax=Streptomyces pacificus TaxID=2705029 RepID=A0A6A0B351_9ACTN|nr:hypothetical protein SCWH03_52110 [Streptomyces pacificus]